MPDSWPEQHYTKGRYRITLEWIGEGVYGDYDRTDPDDEPLLRFGVQYKGQQVVGPHIPVDAMVELCERTTMDARP